MASRYVESYVAVHGHVCVVCAMFLVQFSDGVSIPQVNYVGLQLGIFNYVVV